MLEGNIIMILSFSQQLNGKPTYFIEKIWECLPDKDIDVYDLIVMDYRIRFGKEWDGKYFINHNPKLHTIREDKKSRWGAGSDIHFVINSRTKNYFQFAPVIKCKSVQTIEIKDVSHLPNVSEYGIVLGYPVKDMVFNLAFSVIIDGIPQTEGQITQLAINDGFDSVEDFFAYFNKDFKGVIVHWTDLKY